MSNSLEIKEFEKSQFIRLVDVFVIAPICVYAGVKYKDVLPTWLSVGLIAIGVGTLVYNANNYLLNKEKNKEII
jgi:hypothetical protein